MQAITAIDEDTFTTLGMIDSYCEYDENYHTDAAKIMMTSMTMAMMVGMIMMVTMTMTTTI